MWIHPLLRVSKGPGRVLLAARSRNSFGNVPATSNSISSTTLFVSAASRKSWLASSMVPSSVAMPLIERTLSPTWSSPHLQFMLGKERKGTRRQRKGEKQPHNQAWVTFARKIYYYTDRVETNLQKWPQRQDNSFCTAHPSAERPWKVTRQKTLVVCLNSDILCILVVFPATCRKKKKVALTFLKVNTMANWRMVSARARGLLPYVTVYSSFQVLAPSETEANGTENCMDSSV